jgi:methylated-DNA-protein-cysteine methyltransferase-like protein
MSRENRSRKSPPIRKPSEFFSPYQQFCRSVYKQVREIPTGKVTTYGSIADSIPSPQGIDPLAYRRIRARWVGYALGACPPDVPWWRVVNARGEISLRGGHGPHIQRVLLEEEGIRFSPQGRVNLANYQWKPASAE